MEFRDKLRSRLEESFGVNFQSASKEVVPDIVEGDVKLGGEEMALANKETFVQAIQQIPDEEFGIWLTKAMTNKALDELAHRLQQVNPEAAADNGQPPANSVDDLSGLTGDQDEVSPEAAPEDDSGLGDIDSEVNTDTTNDDPAADEFDLNL